MHDRMIAVLCLDEKLTDTVPSGGLEDRSVFDWPTKFYRVPGATVQRVLAMDSTLLPTLIKTGRQAQDDGASLVLTNCGYMVAYNQALSESLAVPVATSSLLLLPLLNALHPSGAKIGVLTFDAVNLTNAHLEAAWPAFNRAVVVKYGMEATPSWARIYHDGHYDWAEIQRDSLRVVAKMKEDHPDISSIIVECCALWSFMPAIRTLAEVPAYDLVSLATMIAGGQDFRDHQEALAAGITPLDRQIVY